MKKPKIIHLPVDKINELKKLAVDSGFKSFKAWIEHVILFQLK